MPGPEQIRQAWNRNGFAAYLALSVLLSVGFGYSICSMEGRAAMVLLAEQQVKERASLIRKHTADVKYLREQLLARNATIARQSDQLALNGGKAADGANAALQVIEKQTSEVKAQ